MPPKQSATSPRWPSVYQQRDLEQAGAGIAGGAWSDVLRPPGRRTGTGCICQSPPGLLTRRRNHYRVLREQEKPGVRCADGQGAFRQLGAGHGHPALDAVSSDPAEGMRGPGEASTINERSS